MIIKQITLHNFRQFRDATISFSTNHTKNVTVVMGENGSGKTTLEQAFMWCLYGTTTFAIQEVINRDIRDSLQSNDSAKVTVELLINHRGHNYQIKRQQTFLKKTVNVRMENEYFSVREQDDNGDFVKLSDGTANIMIQEFLPEDLAKFFFFDGERLDHMSNELLAQKRSDHFKGAVRGLVGLTAMMEAIEHLGTPAKKSSVIGKFDSEIDDNGNDDLAEIAEQLNRLNVEEGQLAERLDRLKPEEARYNNAIIDVKSALKAMQRGIDNQKIYERYEKELDNERIAKSEDKKAIYQHFSKHVGYYFSLPLLEKALEEIKTADKLDKGIPNIHADTVEFLLKRGTCICGTPLKEHPEAIEHLQSLIKTLPPHSIGNMVGQFTKQVQNRLKHEDDFFEQLNTKVSSYQKRGAAINGKEDDINELQKLLPDQGRVKELKNRERVAQEVLDKLKDDIFQANSRYMMIKSNIKKLDTKREQIRKSSSKNRQNLIYLAYAKAILQQLKESYEKKEIIVRQELENRINRIFEEIYDGGIQISVDDKYNITTSVIDSAGTAKDELEKNTAQSYAIIFAFISGIIEMAKNNRDENSDDAQVFDEGFPLVMDAPLSAFDKDRIQKICTVLPTIADQIIIFIKDTDGEIAEQYMSDIIDKKWLIQSQTQTSSTVVERS